MFTEAMKYRRALLGMSQAELAKEASETGITFYQQTIAKIESGARAIRLDEASAIAAALGSSIGEMTVTAVRVFNSRQLARELQEAEQSLAAVNEELVELDRFLDAAQVLFRRREQLARHSSSLREKVIRAKRDLVLALEAEREVEVANGPDLVDEVDALIGGDVPGRNYVADVASKEEIGRVEKRSLGFLGGPFEEKRKD
ncbi:helix-turn-helix transcriptional regulator [Kitasatospora aureofaciens]|uniref:helix-turn-helix transcriptional regulator n=1 Tax=Kitasatospora aureofaciens TaxID=1894 RepID=UPI00381EDD74